jgi:hypothetical protein
MQDPPLKCPQQTGLLGEWLRLRETVEMKVFSSDMYRNLRLTLQEFSVDVENCPFKDDLPC